MNYRIWKYPLRITDLQRVEMPARSLILSVAEKDGALCLWAMGDVSKERTTRLIEIIGTNHQIENGPNHARMFIGTVVSGSFAWHVFERTTIDPELDENRGPGL